ncbi:MAG: chromate transporter, partial [Pseudomonadota bacterium]
MIKHQHDTASSRTSGSVWEVFITFLKLGLTSFGGPVAHLGYFHKELVEKRRWLSDAQYAQLLALCQFLPGPASSQLGFALGLTRAGWLGAMSAFVAFTMPSALLLFAFAMLIGEVQSDALSVVVDGLKLVAVVIVADAVWGMWQKLCDARLTRAVAIMVAVFL